MTVSLKIYALLLGVAIIIFSVAFGGYIYQQIDEAEETLSDWKFQMAKHEVVNLSPKSELFCELLFAVMQNLAHLYRLIW